MIIASKNQQNESGHPRVLHVGTSALSLKLMRGQLAFLREAGFEVVVISSPGKELEFAERSEGIKTYAIPMAREVSPRRDLKSLLQLYGIMRRLRPSITNVGTPKAGFLGGIAAWLARVPCRFYTLRGLRCETTRGLKLWILLLLERIACLCAHRVICVSESLRQKAVALGIVESHRTLVLGSGSSNGIDASLYVNTPMLVERALKLREDLGIPAGAPVVGFVGRLTRDKGVAELVRAFAKLCKTFRESRLLLVGDYEDGDPVPAETRREIEANPKIIRTGFIPEAAAYIQLMNVLALPTYREGFPNVILEAHAAGKPVVATRATGVTDAIIDGVNGILVPIGDFEKLAAALARVLNEKYLAEQMARSGRDRALRGFQPNVVWSALLSAYVDLLKEKGLARPIRRAEASLQSVALSAD